MEDTAKKLCSILFDVLVQKGVKNVVCSPGSRNAPLLIAAASRESIKKYFVVDERSAGFVGLGLAAVKQEPVALICTSGSALLNYGPAAAEAFYQGVPLIIISADRPLQWIDQDDSQTIHQTNALENFVKKSYSIPALSENEQEVQWYVNRVANDAMLQACNGRPGPVHINIQIEEPLNKKCLKKESVPRIINLMTSDSIANKEVFKNLASTLIGKKVLLVCGFGFPDSLLQKTVSNFARFPNVAVMAETISNLHFPVEDYAVDSVLTSYPDEIIDALSPDIVISLGGALVSRKLKEFLRRNRHSIEHWSVGFSNALSDPFMSLNLKIEIEPSRFFRSLNAALNKLHAMSHPVEYNKEWHEKRKRALKIKNEIIEKSVWSELKAFDIILRNIPSDRNLFLSNGTAIRYAQIINYRLPHASYCNRGVSGIDGSVSTAIGGGMAYRGETILITGDLSMAYDVGSLAIKDVPNGFKIIVIDNQGGGIFRFIPSTSGISEREEYFCQPPVLPLKNLAEGYGWRYYEFAGVEELENNLNDFFSCPEKSILKIKVDGIESAEILKKYMNAKVL